MTVPGNGPESDRLLPPPPATPLELFLALTALSSPSRAEGAKAAAIIAWLERCPDSGLSITRDRSQALTGSDTGNVIIRRRVDPARPTVLFVAHLDTVAEPGDVICPVLGEDGVIRSAGPTILGADNQAAVAAVLSLLARPRPEHANLVVVLTTSEESGTMGVTALEPLAAEIDYAFPVDGSSPVGTVLEAGLGQMPFTLTLRGRRAHAAKPDGGGINAVAAAAQIVAGLELGWVGESVLNLSRIEGGSATNVVPDLTVVHGEARAFSSAAIAARLAQVRERAAEVAERAGVSWDLVELTEQGAPPFPPSGAPENLAIATRALDGLGIDLVRERCWATLEANFLHAMGLPSLGIASGGRGPHSVEESLDATELDRLVSVLDRVAVEAALAPLRRE